MLLIHFSFLPVGIVFFISSIGPDCPIKVSGVKLTASHADGQEKSHGKQNEETFSNFCNSSGIFPLTTQCKLFDNCLIAFQIDLLEIIKKFSSTCCHHQQTTSRMEILTMYFEMFGEVGDASGE